MTRKVYSTIFAAIALIVSGCGEESYPGMSGGETDRPVQVAKQLPDVDGMVFIEGGEFMMGTDGGMRNEEPSHSVRVSPFYMDKYEVTVGEFEKFVNETKYATEAERFGWSAVFDVGTGKWSGTKGAYWRNPDGDGKRPSADEPVTQISWNDANAFAAWAGKRLPTEAEWEFAARGGLIGKEYAWGDELRPDGSPAANWWQGSFPDNNTAEDGFVKRAPVGNFAANGYGLFDMGGNVWEWVADRYSETYYRNSPDTDPAGPNLGAERVLRGGSWMCSETFCSNYRVAARSYATPDSAMNNTGFRCVKDK